MQVRVNKVLSTSAGDLRPGAVVDAAGWANLDALIEAGYISPVGPAPAGGPSPDLTATQTPRQRRGREVTDGVD